MNQHYENIHRYDFLTKELLEEEYITNGLSDAQIAKKFSMPSKSVVWRKRKAFGINNRYNAKSNRHAVTNRKYNITKDKAIQMVSAGATFEDIATYMGCSVMVAKRRFKELGLTKTQDHADKYKFWDVELTDQQKQLIVGSLLGDGTIAKHGAFSCSHSVKQRDYIEHKMEALASIHSGKMQHAIHKASGVNGEHHESLHFTTGCNKFCAELRKIYYPHGIKSFPYEYVFEHITPRTIAYWHMDDGTNDKRNGSCRLLTYGYPCLQNVLMKHTFEEKFGIRTTLHWDKSANGYYHYFPVSETPKLFDLIRPYIIPSMAYKVQN